MNLTHHVRSTRTFIMLVVVVLVAVYTAITIAGIQTNNSVNEFSVVTATTTTNNIDTSSWQDYRDTTYPLLIKIPPTWTSSANIVPLTGYTVSLTPPKSQNSIKIFINKNDFVAVDNLTGNQQTIAKNLTVTNYDNLIYTIKVGDNYYTFDGTMAVKYKSELSEIVRLARFE